MATSQNGWTVYNSSAYFTPFKWITGRISKNKDVIAIFTDLCEWFDANIENINASHSWGYAYRAIRGGVGYSNHASGTAIDLNAPAHPMGKSGTFSKSKMAKIRAKMKEYKGVVRWGGEYADEMHFEINAGATAVKNVAANLRKSNTGTRPVTSKPPAAKPVTPAPKPSTKPSGAKQWPATALPATAKHTTASHKAWVTLLASVGYKDKDLGTAMQKWLRSLGYYPARNFVIDGVMGKYAVQELQKFLKAKGHYKGIIDGGRGAMTVRAEIAYLNAQRRYL